MRLFLCLCALMPLAKGSQGPVVTIANGQLEGITLESRGGRPYSAFMGIPYANQPEKFEEAIPASPWTGVLKATKFEDVCAQFDPRVQRILGSENCLFINVFSPSGNPSQSLPVLAFIHGGGFQFGNSDENGADYMMDEDVVFVTFNYRLGAYGFLSTEDEIIPGNLGLKDQVLALEWIQENIVHFGGNPHSVTLSGESAGGAAVGLHVLSPLSRGLFHRAICSSGTALNDWALTQNPLVETLNFAKRLGCPTSSSTEIKSCLQTKSTSEIFTPAKDFSQFDKLPFTPVIEPPSTFAFLSATPQEIYHGEKFSQVPLLVTVTQDEGLLLHSAAIMKFDDLRNHVNKHWMEMAPIMFHYPDHYCPAVKDKISKQILKFYFSNQELIVTEATFQNLTNVFTDTGFMYGSRLGILAHARHAHFPTYAVILSFEGIWSQIWSLGYTQFLGMGHADDLQYLFSNVGYPKFAPGSDTFAASQKLVRVYTNFAKFGNPNFEEKGNWHAVTREEINSGVINWMYLRNRDQEAQASHLEKRMQFWDQMFSQHFQEAETWKEEL